MSPMRVRRRRGCVGGSIVLCMIGQPMVAMGADGLSTAAVNALERIQSDDPYEQKRVFFSLKRCVSQPRVRRLWP